MIVSDPGAHQFDADRWRDEDDLARRFDAEYRQDSAALFARLDRAYACEDVKTAVIGGGVLASHDDLRSVDVLERTRSLVRLDRCAEAAAMFDRNPALQQMKFAKCLFWWRRAQAGAGRLEEALAGMERVLSRRPDLPGGADFRACLVTAIAVGATPPTDASEILRLARLFETWSLRPSARRLVEQVIMGGGVDAADSPALLDLAELALGLVDPAGVETFLNGRRFDDEERRLGLVMLCQARQGGGGLHHPAPSLPASGATPQGALTLAMGRALTLESAGDLDAAIAGLGRLSIEHPLDSDIRRALARCVGSKVVDIVKPRVAGGGRRRVINLLPFYNEFTMFQMRLDEMADWVDEFVVVEATQTFTGLDKPLNFEARKAEFAPFADKITHVVVDRFPPYIDAAWSRDFFQRDMAIQAIAGRLEAEDLILLTDADEIVDRRAIVDFDGDCAALEMPTFKFFLNYRPIAGHRKHILRKASIWKAAYLEQFGSSYLRFYMAIDRLRAPAIADAGWHFTSMMDAAEVSRKVDSYAHQEQSKAHFRSADFYDGLLQRIRDGDYEPDWERVDIDDTFPAYVQRNQAALADMILGSPTAGQPMLAGAR